jgi:hypothetical protein
MAEPPETVRRRERARLALALRVFGGLRCGIFVAVVALLVTCAALGYVLGYTPAACPAEADSPPDGDRLAWVIVPALGVAGVLALLYAYTGRPRWVGRVADVFIRAYDFLSDPLHRNREDPRS